MRVIKSEKALFYSDRFKQQCPQHELIECAVAVKIKIYYASRKPDLDESLILDLMQGLIYRTTVRSKRNISTGHWTRNVQGQRYWSSLSKKKPPSHRRLKEKYRVTSPPGKFKRSKKSHKF